MHALYVQECQLFSQVSIFWIAGPPLLIHLTNFVVIMFTNYQHNTANILCSSFNFLSQNKIKLKLNYTNTLWYWSYYVICSVFLESWFDFQVELYCHNPNRNSKSTIVSRSVKFTLIKGSCKNGISIFQPIFHPFTCEMKALDDSIPPPPPLSFVGILLGNVYCRLIPVFLHVWNWPGSFLCTQLIILMVKIK